MGLVLLLLLLYRREQTAYRLMYRGTWYFETAPRTILMRGDLNGAKSFKEQLKHYKSTDHIKHVVKARGVAVQDWEMIHVWHDKTLGLPTLPE